MKSVVITGAGSGIGRACALRLAADGYRVTVNDLRPEAGEAVAAEIKAKGGTAIAAAGDVSSEMDVENILGASRPAFGDPTHLVNNAGFVHQALFVDLTPADFDRMFAVHVRGVFLMTKAVLPAMLASKSGVVVNMASQLGQIGGIELTHYSAAKSAVIGLGALHGLPFSAKDLISVEGLPYAFRLADDARQCREGRRALTRARQG
jgi:3-oxoacyl-[acyl-carrier protein] reductase